MEKASLEWGYWLHEVGRNVLLRFQYVGYVSCTCGLVVNLHARPERHWKRNMEGILYIDRWICSHTRDKYEK